VTESGPRFPAYGDDGDLAGARRARRSFRFVVLSVALLTLFAWIAESQLRHSRAEANFLTGITHSRDAARVFLLAAIKQDAETSDAPTAKYTQALAVRQEDDVALDTYARAYELDPKNALFAIRYGCRLFLLNRPAQAVEIFRTARTLPPANALPRYLEAAALSKSSRDPAVLGEAMVIVSRANNTREPLIFPKPVWWSGYPQSGTQYAQLSREACAEVCAPLLALTQQVVLAAGQQDQAAAGQDEKTWLRQIETLGRRLVSDGDPKGSLQAIAGVSIQLQALQALRALLDQDGEGGSDEAAAIAEREVELRQALEILNEFEANRDEEIAAIAKEHTAPIWLVLQTVLVMAVAYVFARIVHGLLRYRKSAWTLPHSPFGRIILLTGVVALFVVLTCFALIQRVPGAQDWYLAALISTWWAIVTILIGFGLVYPVVRVASPEDIGGKSGRLEDLPDVMRHARRAYRRVYVAFTVRYFGILIGGFLCAACAWMVFYRVFSGLYPWKTNLLASGLIPEEIETVKRALTLLAGG
jgi:tetratricopeptide (TPR) repeat protein